MRDLKRHTSDGSCAGASGEGIIGSLAQNYYSFIGALRNPKPLIEATGPEVASQFKDEGVDLLFITPT